MFEDKMLPSILIIIFWLAGLGGLFYHENSDTVAIKVKQWARSHDITVMARAEASGFERVESDHFIIYHQDEDQRVLLMTALAAENAYTKVNTFFDYEPQSKIPITMYSQMEAMVESFGWEKDEKAIGVYSDGRISMIMPTEWLRNQYSQIELETEGPVLHEYTHYVVDAITKGNYTRWWTEGLAQYLEKKTYGFQFKPPKLSDHEEFYTLHALASKYDALNQNKVYWQSLMAVEYLADRYGEDAIFKLMNALREGQIFHKAVENSLQIDYDKFETGYYQYLYYSSSKI